MTPTKGMSTDQLKDEIIRRKLSAFDQARHLLKNPDMLKPSGFDHWSGPIELAIKMNEARLKDWEKNNPDDADWEF